jgi:transcriptional regulator with XRE-family HTH domain
MGERIKMKNEKQTLGEFFKEARRIKGISIDEIVRDTNIPKRYLEAIESDNFEPFPGETYAMGFISNYAEALEVDHELAIALYKRQMKIEQDAPIEELVGRKKSSWIENNNFIIGAGAGALLLIIIVVFLLSRRSGEDNAQAAPRSYYFSYDEIGKVSLQKLKTGDSIFLTNETKNTEIEILRIDPSRSMMFRISNKTYTIKISELMSVDSEDSGTNDLGLELVSAKPKEARLALTLLKEGAEVSEISNTISNKYNEYILSESEFLVSPGKGPVNIKIVSQGTGYLSYIPDGRDEKQLAVNNATVLTISFTNNLLLYIGNSGAVKIVLGNKEEAGGGWGEVGKSFFYWKPKNGQFSLVRAVLK